MHEHCIKMSKKLRPLTR